MSQKKVAGPKPVEWEYQLRNWERGNDGAMNDLQNKEGLSGWECYNIIKHDGNTYTFFFKRIKRKETQ